MKIPFSRFSDKLLILCILCILSKYSFLIESLPAAAYT